MPKHVHNDAFPQGLAQQYPKTRSPRSSSLPMFVGDQNWWEFFEKNCQVLTSIGRGPKLIECWSTSAEVGLRKHLSAPKTLHGGCSRGIVCGRRRPRHVVGMCFVCLAAVRHTCSCFVVPSLFNLFPGCDGSQASQQERSGACDSTPVQQPNATNALI